MSEPMRRDQYEYLIVHAAQRIHELGCPDEPCYHEMLIYSAEAMQADAAFSVVFEHFDHHVPPEIPMATDVLPW